MKNHYNKVSDLYLDTLQAIIEPPIGIDLHFWPKFTHYIGGLRPNELTLFCAGTGVGKTAMLSNISTQLCLSGVPHFCAPIETGDTDFVARILSVLAEDTLNNGMPHPIEKIKAINDKHQQTVVNSPLWIARYDNRVEVAEMIGLLKHMHDDYGIKVALLDNLNFFLNVTSTNLEKAEMDNAIHDFVMALKELPIHVILVTHPKKTDNGRVESEFDIKGSSTAVQEAANVILFNRPKSEDIERGKSRSTDRELVFRKIRKRGEFVGHTIQYRFNKGRFSEL